MLFIHDLNSSVCLGNSVRGSEFVEACGEVDHECGGAFVGLCQGYAHAELLHVESGTCRET